MLFDFNGFKILMVIFEIVLEAGIWMRAGRGVVRGLSEGEGEIRLTD